MTATSSNTNSIVDLNNYALITCQGPDATTFLQGQLTCDMRHIDPQQGQLAAYCNHKGRVITTLHLVPQENGYLLCLPPEMDRLFLENIKRYALFSKVSFEPLTDWSTIGYSGEGPDDLPDSVFSISLPGTPSRALLIGPNAAIKSFQKTLEAKASLADQTTWAALNVAAGFASIYPETSTLFTPQMLKLEQFNAVSFKKGCFVGQEVIARTQHLGTLKRHLHHAKHSCDKLTKPGDKLTDANQQAVGTIAEAGANGELLAVIEDRALSQSIYFGQSLLSIKKQ